MVRDELRLFLRDPKGFAAGVTSNSSADWLAGLEFAERAIEESESEYALREAQRVGWTGIADQRVALILGPPGTGKTFALSWMALGFIEGRRLAEKPCRVFVTGFTRNSIANLLEAVGERAEHATKPVRFVWLGNPPDQGLPDIVEVLQPKQLSEVLKAEHVVVGATGWSLYRAIDQGNLSRSDGPTAPLFDLVCIDEASQMVVSHGLLSLAGLTPGGRVLVAGDDQQLAPVRETNDREVDGQKLGASLYGFLKHAGVAEFPLDETFRLNDLLARYPARAFYDGRYRSVGAAKERRLSLQDGWEEGLPQWMKHALDPENPVAILLYDGLLAGTANEFEALLVQELVEALKERLPNADDIDTATLWHEHLAVVSPHRAQNSMIRQRLRTTGLDRDCVVETVDRIQGRERDSIIASYTVSDPEFAQMEADFIFSPERFNVTVTRARTKLILIVSRRLLSVIPDEQETFERAQVLRNYVYESHELATWDVRGPGGQKLPVTVRVKSFREDTEHTLVEEPTQAPPEPELLSPELKELLDEIRKATGRSNRGNVADFGLRRILSRHTDEIRAGFRALQVAGFVNVSHRDGGHGVFWTASIKDPPAAPHACTAQTVAAEVRGVIRTTRRGPKAPAYWALRNNFQWIGENGDDMLEPLLDELVDAGELVWGEHPRGWRTIDVAEADEPEEPVVRPPLPDEPSVSDFELLNWLEDREQRRVNFGVFESWFTFDEVLKGTGREREALAAALRRLRQDGWLMQLDDGRIRTRAGELARELRYIKQRFKAGDADNRPFLVRSAKVRFQDRDKPIRSIPLSRTVTALNGELESVAGAEEALAALHSMLSTRWSVPDPLISGFQDRGLRELVPAWFGRGDTRSFVVTAETGSGKTEAAALPLILASAIDTLNGVAGCRAILAYPRIRLANNQAQRLAGYLAALAREPGMPTLSLAVQSGEVPSTPEKLRQQWRSLGSSTFEFPLFSCPELGCDGKLAIKLAGRIDEPDHLSCRSCAWEYLGWVGTKKSMGRRAPTLLILTTESLHGWLHSHWRGRLFGDAPDSAAPRALVADEIHLYSQIHGAQVGYAFRRLLARMRINSDGIQPLAIGMSATLGEPQRIWMELSGAAPVSLISPTQTEREPNPKSREYFYFVQPEVESRGKDIAGASTTIQALMCLAHGMRRRTGARGGYRALAFLDSIDKVKRLHGDYLDAETNSRLATLRTSRLGTVSPEVEPRTGCCGQPESCSRFIDAECWYFASKDPHQEKASGPYHPGDTLEVASTPIFSGAKEGVDERIRTSDVVFATSSLEVGFDDPDMTLVYQHYAPLNAASFVQRKGRGGRGADDRPVTGVTLSVYSPRDTWFFRRPERMLEAHRFQVPLNMRNYFVRRGQVLSTLLDAAAREHFYRADPSPDFPPTVFDAASQMVEEIFGSEIYGDLGVADLRDLWRRTRPGFLPEATHGLSKWVDHLPEVPSALFETINLPAVRVQFQGDSGQLEMRDEDISLALFNAAPGTATRRYGMQSTHWAQPAPGRSPWSAVEADASTEQFEPVEGGLDALKRELPRYLHDEIGDDVAPAVIRPREFQLSRLGEFYGATWTGAVGYEPSSGTFRALSEASGVPALPVNPKSSGALKGFLICDARQERGQPRKVGQLEPLTTGLYAYYGLGTAEDGTGLKVSRIFWGSESRVVVDVNEYKREEYQVVQTFVDPVEYDAYANRGVGGVPRVQLYGYCVETEGIRLRLDSCQLDNFVAHFQALIAGTADERWLRGQFFRFLVLSGAPRAGMNRFQARELADLLVTARAMETRGKQLAKLLRRWDAKRFGQLLLGTYQDALAYHPLLTARRVEQLGEELLRPALSGMGAFLLECVRRCADDNEFKGYVRSLAVHSLAVRLQQNFVIYGAGDDRRVLFHCKLPIQFGELADDVIVVCEDGQHGDGTTRTFIEQLDTAFTEFRGTLSECPNAREDAILRRILNDEEFIGCWTDEAASSRSDESIRAMVEELKLDLEEDSGSVQAALRLLWDTEEFGAHRFSYLQLHREVHSVDVALEDEMGRAPSAWELVGRVVRLAESGDETVPAWSTLLEGYRALEDASSEGSLEASARLADQVYKLSARLCVDGCQACLHTGSPLFPPQLMDATVSRLVTTQLHAFLGWPQ
ncbi:MAG: AAA domain-containing protein [Myxococcota bacterium]|nr:AAA domain-containing protein [Myxococcota bacterium]